MFLRRVANKLRLHRQFSSAATKLIKVQFHGGVKSLTMSHTKTWNCLSTDMMNALIENITHKWEEKSLRVIIITAEGPIFSSGHDLKELASSSGRDKQQEVFNTSASLMKAITDCPVPVIAAVNGHAVAGGCQLVAQCDLAICTKQSKFSTPGANLGLFCSTPGIALARAVPKAIAMKMLLTGKPILAPEALQSGLVSHICDNDEFESTLQQICADITSKSRSVIELGKRFYYKQIEERNTAHAYELGGNKMVENLNIPDGKEGIQSFVEKRNPNWSH